ASQHRHHHCYAKDAKLRHYVGDGLEIVVAQKLVGAERRHHCKDDHSNDRQLQYRSVISKKAAQQRFAGSGSHVHASPQASFLRSRHAVIAVAPMMIAPTTTRCHVVSTFIRMREFLIITSVNTPSMVPRTEPRPPKIDAPPRTTAAMTSSSQPMKSRGFACQIIDACSRPAKPARRPAVQ